MNSGDGQWLNGEQAVQGNTAGTVGGYGAAGGEPEGSAVESVQSLLRPTLLGDSVQAESGRVNPSQASDSEVHRKVVKNDGDPNGTGQEGNREDRADIEELHADKVPDSPDGYSFTFAPGVEIDEQALEAFREVAFEQGISRQQASQIATLYAGLVERQQEEQRAALDEAEAGWLKELKQGRNYAGTVASARLAMERFGTPELNALLNETRLGSHPALVRFVAHIGRELGEPVFMHGKGNGRPQRLNFYETMEG